jgi:hypothetical protein
MKLENSELAYTRMVLTLVNSHCVHSYSLPTLIAKEQVLVVLRLTATP